MPIRIRKSFKIAPGVRLNLSNTGMRASVGGGGVRYVTGSRRRRRASCCPFAILTLPILLPVRLVQLAYRRLRHEVVTP